MSRDVFDPDRAKAERAAHLVTARAIFQRSGIVGVVNSVKGLLPEGTEIKTYGASDNDDISPHIALIGPERDGVKTRFVYGDLRGSDWWKCSPVETPTRERMSLSIGVFGVNSSMFDFAVHKSVLDLSSGRSSPTVSLLWSGYVGDVSEQRQTGSRLHYGLRQAFTFSPDQDQRLQQLLPPASPVRVATYSFGRLVEVR